MDVDILGVYTILRK